MASETKSIFLYGNPTDKKLEMLKQIQTKYTDKINEFIVADNKSNVFIIRRENSFFNSKYKQERIELSFINNTPIYCIDYYNIDTNEDISNQSEQNLIFTFISVKQINVLKLKPEVSNLLTINISNDVLPDYSFAQANLPSKTLSNLLLISTFPSRISFPTRPLLLVFAQ